MLGLGGDDEDSQRMWNLICFKMYATDKEIEEMAPVFVAVIIFLAIMVGLVYCFWK